MNSLNVVSGESSHKLSFNLSKQDIIYDDILAFVYFYPPLEENDLNINLMQKQINVDNQYLVDDRYVFTKEENIALQSHVHVLEEQQIQVQKSVGVWRMQAQGSHSPYQQKYTIIHR